MNAEEELRTSEERLKSITGEAIGSIASSPERFRTLHAEHIRRCGETGVTIRSMGTLGTARLARSAARRLMQENGVRADQVSQVRGFADQMLRKPEDAQDPSNRRISLIVPVDKKKRNQRAKKQAGQKKEP